MAEKDNKYYSVKYLLQTTKADRDRLEREFFNARRLQIALIKEVRKNFHKYYNESEVKRIFKGKKPNQKIEKAEQKILNDLAKKHNLTQYSLYNNYIKEYRARHNKVLKVVTARGVAENISKSIESKLKNKRKSIHIPKELLTLSDNSGAGTIRYRKGYMAYDDLKLKVKIKSDDLFRIDALMDDVKATKIKRVRNKDGSYRYYLVIVFVGLPPAKKRLDKKTGDIMIKDRSIGDSAVGIDIGTSTIAVASSSGDVILEQFGADIPRISKEIARLNRKLDRQRRANNPENFNQNGTVKKGIYREIEGKKVLKKLTWTYSKSYKKTRGRLRELQRKRATRMRQYHEDLANRILRMGDTIFIEEMRYSILAKRSKNTEISEKTGRFKRKKRFGRSIGLHSPAQFKAILNRKLGYGDKKMIEVNNFKIKASQFNHMTGEYVSKKLNKRWSELTEGVELQRDLYSAFLLMNCIDVDVIGLENCINRFDKFKASHDVLIENLKNKKEHGSYFPSSIGV